MRSIRSLCCLHVVERELNSRKGTSPTLSDLHDQPSRKIWVAHQVQLDRYFLAVVPRPCPTPALPTDSSLTLSLSSYSYRHLESEYYPHLYLDPTSHRELPASLSSLHPSSPFKPLSSFTSPFVFNLIYPASLWILKVVNRTSLYHLDSKGPAYLPGSNPTDLTMSEELARLQASR